MANYTGLRAANIARQLEWFKDATVPDVPPSFRSNELAGETGEVLEHILTYMEQGLTWGHLQPLIAEELGDVIISADLCAMDLGLSLEVRKATSLDGSWRSSPEVCMRMVLAALRCCNLVKKIDRERLGIPGSRANPQEVGVLLQGVVDWAYMMADHIGVSLWPEVVAKFNSTSAKVGLTTRLV